MARVSNYKLPADIQKLQYEANQRLAKLEQSYARTQQPSTRQAIEFLQKRAGSYNAPAKRFTFEPAKGTDKSLDAQLQAYKRSLEETLKTKTTRTQLDIIDKKRKATFEEDVFGGRKLTQKQYKDLIKAVNQQGDSVIYTIRETFKSIDENQINVKGDTSDRQLINDIINNILAGVPAVDLVSKSKVLEYND